MNTRPMGPCVLSGGPAYFFREKSRQKSFLQSFALPLGMPPCGAGEGAMFFPAMERTKDRRGTAPRSGRSKSPFPRTPSYGSGPLRSFAPIRRAKSSSVFVLLPAHWGLLPSKFDGVVPLNYTASCFPSCLVQRWSFMDRLPWLCQGGRCAYSTDTSKFLTR